MTDDAYKPSAQETEAGGWVVQGHPAYKVSLSTAWATRHPA